MSPQLAADTVGGEHARGDDERTWALGEREPAENEARRAS